MDDEEGLGRRCRVAPLAPLAIAVGLGVVLDRAAEPCGVRAWAAVALGALAAAVVLHGMRRRWGDRAGPASAAIGLVWACLGGAWHHERYVERAADDLSRVVDAEGWGHGERRVAWVRGVVTGEASFRPGDGGPDDRGMTRLAVGLTAIRDAAAAGGWRPASGGVQVWVGGDRSDLRPGRGGRGGGPALAGRGAAQPRRVRPAADAPRRGGPAPACRRRPDRDLGRPGRGRLALDAAARGGPRLELSPARRGARPGDGPAGRGAPARPARRRQPRGQ